MNNLPFAGDGRPCVVLAIDRPGWALDRIARQIALYFGHEFDLVIAPYPALVAGECDVLVALAWPCIPLMRANLRIGRVVCAVYDSYMWKHGDGPKKLGWSLTRSDVLAVANRRIAAELAPLHSLPVFVTEDGVDTQLFKPGRFPWRFSAGWAGDSRAGASHDLKGVGIIREGCRKAGIRLDVCDAAEGGLRYEAMPRWHRRQSVYVCASSAEGTPNPVLEAMACGRPVISTMVGLVPDLIRDGENGWLIERSGDAIAQALDCARRADLVAMGTAARATAEKHDWSLKIGTWREAIRAALAMGPRVSAGTVEGAAPVGEAIKPPVQMRPRSVLSLVDVKGWAFDVKAREMAKYLPEFDFTIHSVARSRILPDTDAFEAVYVPYLRWGGIVAQIPWGKALGALRSRWFDPARPGVHPEDVARANRYRAFQALNQTVFDELHRAGVKNLHLLTNPVDMERFPVVTDVREPIAAWCGNKRRGDGDIKGFGDIIEPVCRKVGIPLQVAEYTDSRLPPEAMPGFYRSASLYVCASEYEGVSNSVMEALASGLALVTTDCGNVRELQESQLEHCGETGILIVKRHPRAFADALNGLRRDPARIAAMGAINRAEMEARWCWPAWRGRFHDYFAEVIK